MRRPRKTTGVPVLKLPPDHLFDVVLALRDHEFDRDGFKDSVLALFPEKEEKSVFRGMAIPSLRTLGLLIGFEQETHLSSDGALVAEASISNSFPASEPIRLLLREIEFERNLSAVWHKDDLTQEYIRQSYAKVEQGDTADIPKGDFTGRINRWLNYLEYFGIVSRSGEARHRTLPVLKAVPVYSEAEMKSFAKAFRAAYRHLMRGEIGESVIAIEDVRREVAIRLWKDKRVIVMRRDFDRLLTRSLEAGITDVHLHRSMGADEELFVFKDTSYQSVSIKEN
jgi:hypothetical protein